MTKIKFLLALMTVFFVCGELSAQEFGRGRFLKRLRDEIVGNNKKEAEKKKKAQAKKQAPTPADPRSRPPQQNSQLNRNQAQRNQAQRNQAQRNRVPAQPNRNQQPQSRNQLQQNRTQPQSSRPQVPSSLTQLQRRLQQAEPNSRQGQPATRQPQTSRPSNRSSFQQPTPPLRSGTQQVSTAKRSTRKGFGMEVVEKKGNVIVSKVDPLGNAAESEIRPGDLIVEVGGLEIESVSDFNEFTKILGEGDQMEFKISSRGKKRSANITFGVVPDLEDESAPSFAPPAKNDQDFVSNRKPNYGLQSVMERPDGVKDIAKSSAIRSNELRTSTLQRTISNQQREIESLRLEIVRLRQQVGVNQKNEGTSLNGPGN